MYRPTSTRRSIATAWMPATLLLFTFACGGGEEPAETAAPAGDAEPAAAAAAAEPGNPAVDDLGDGTATVSGTVTFAGQAPTLSPIRMDADPACAQKHAGPVMPQTLVLGDGNTMGNIFVKVKSAPEKQWPAPSQPATIDQDGCMYHPHVIGVMAGQPLQFLNSDELLHNVHGLPEENREFNIGMPATVEQSRVDPPLNTPEPLFPVKCDVHPWMQAYVAVMSHPYFDVTAEDGQYAIDRLPAGTYEIEAWHERLGTTTQSVTVADGETATVDFSFQAPQG